MKIKNLAIMAVAGLGLLASGTQAFAEEHWHGDRGRHEYRDDRRWDRERDYRRHEEHEEHEWRERNAYRGGYYGNSYYGGSYYAAPSYDPYYAPPVVVQPYYRPGFGVYFGVR